MSFWSDKIAGQRPQPPAQPVPGPVRQWWQPQAPVAPQQPANAPLVVAPVTQQQPTPSGYGSQTGEVPIGELLQQQDYQTTKAVSARDSEFCPNCQSNNYVSDGKKNSGKHCFDCGYNDRFGNQSMSGISAGSNVPVKTARMQTGTTTAPNFGAVIGHV